MDPYRILLLDLNPMLCPIDSCKRLPKMIQNLPSFEGVDLQTINRVPTKPLSTVPDLILYRPSLNDPFEEIACSLKKKWPKSSLLGLFCVGWEHRKDAISSLLGRLDDFVFCPFKEIDFVPRIQRFHFLEKRTKTHCEATMIKEKLHLESLVGKSECFMKEVQKIPCIAASEATVLISGETGTGKELFARAIHYRSNRSGKPFIPINCGALPDHLFENELFGHVKGAYTDASTAEKGLIAEAEGGTLFLDEIDALSPCAQIKLLRFLQDREYRPLGVARSITADVRLIAATNAKLRALVEVGRFREDLFYRLNIFPLAIPPLRERTGDILLLAAHFLSRYGAQNKREPSSLSSEAGKKMTTYAWPGNVRELEGVIQQALILTDSPILQPGDLDLPSSCPQKTCETSFLREAKAQAVRQFERTYLTDLLAEHRGNITCAAKAAGKDRRSFQRLLQKHGLNRQSFQS